MKTEQVQQEALDRAQHGQAFTNYPTILATFAARGIPTSEIKPRENVFTYHAWRALGRQVRKGEKGVRVVTFRNDDKEVKMLDGTTKIEHHSRPWSAYVFHTSQTDKAGAI